MQNSEVKDLLFESHDLRLENVIIRAGESAIKECSNIEAV